MQQSRSRRTPVYYRLASRLIRIDVVTYPKTPQLLLGELFEVTGEELDREKLTKQERQDVMTIITAIHHLVLEQCGSSEAPFPAQPQDLSVVH